MPYRPFANQEFHNVVRTDIAVTAPDVDWLGAGWNRLRADVNAEISRTAAERLQCVFGHHE